MSGEMEAIAAQEAAKAAQAKTESPEGEMESLESRLEKFFAEPGRGHKTVSAQAFENAGGQLEDMHARLGGLRGSVGEVFFRRGNEVHHVMIGPEEGERLGLVGDPVDLGTLYKAPPGVAGKMRRFPIGGAREMVIEALGALGFTASELRGQDIIDEPKKLSLPFENAQRAERPAA